jgi:hypothetical protein
MRNRFLHFILVVCCLFITAIASAQTLDNNETGMRSNGKIFVVMAVCITILTGLIIYLISIDRKIKKIEKQDQ